MKSIKRTERCHRSDNDHVCLKPGPGGLHTAGVVLPVRPSSSTAHPGFTTRASPAGPVPWHAFTCICTNPGFRAHFSSGGQNPPCQRAAVSSGCHKPGAFASVWPSCVHLLHFHCCHWERRTDTDIEPKILQPCPLYQTSGFSEAIFFWLKRMQGSLNERPWQNEQSYRALLFFMATYVAVKWQWGLG